MGKNKKKGKQEDKKSQQRLVKRLEKASGEPTIEDMLAEFQAEQAKKTAISVKSSNPPSPRSHFSLTASPDTGELFLFGGEYFDGKKIFVYADLFVYNVKLNEWSVVESCVKPSPRSGHQMVFMHSTDLPASLWLFGGEFTSPTQSRFLHYRDIWSCRVRTRQWQLVKPQGSGQQGPCARSGHRMVACRQSFYLFGGFSDTGSHTTYFNDLWQFDTSTLHWTNIELTGQLPSPRSACMLFWPNPAQSRSLYVVGGYCKQQLSSGGSGKQKQKSTSAIAERGVALGDIVQIALDKDHRLAVCMSLRPTGFAKPKPPHSSMSGVLIGSTSRALVFGGLYDTEADDGESLLGSFSNQLRLLDLDKAKWLAVETASSLPTSVAKTPSSDPVASDSAVTYDHQVDPNKNPAFTLTLGPTPSCPPSATNQISQSNPPPHPRSSCGLALVDSSLLMIYGGVFESLDRKYTLDDLHSVRIASGGQTSTEGWNCLYAGTQVDQTWLGSDIDDDDDGDDSGDNDESIGGHDDDDGKDCSRVARQPVIIDDVNRMQTGTLSPSEGDDSDSSSDDNDSMTPPSVDGSDWSSYWQRSSSFWLNLVSTTASKDSVGGGGGGNSQPTYDETLSAAARSLAQDFFNQSGGGHRR